MRERDFMARQAKLLREELEKKEQLFFMSFAEPGKFLGGVFMMAKGPVHALILAHGLNINPGGQVRLVALEEQGVPITHPVKFFWNRLLTAREITAIGPDWEEMQHE